MATTKSKVFIDANIPMYAGGKPSPQKQSSMDFLKQVALGKILGVTSAEVFQEILHRFMATRDLKRGFGIFDSFREVPAEVYQVEIEDIVLARTLAKKYPNSRARDLVHVAVMQRHGIKTIASFDSDFDRFREVERIEPTMT
jgi:predicted nucleic acid-binding protein